MKATLTKILVFLEQLEARHISYRLNKVRDALMVEIAVPGQRWEVEFFSDGHVEFEICHSTGDIYNETHLLELLEQFKD